VLFRSFARAADAAGPAATPVVTAPKGIVKEGLSEYFMFTVQGSETIPNGWSKRMRAVNVEGVKFDVLYRMREHQYGTQPVRFFIWTNDEEHKLGECPLPNGQVRVFRDNGRDGLQFLAEQTIQYVPIKAKAEIDLGVDNLVVYARRAVSTERLQFTFRRDPPPDGREWVIGWDEKTRWIDEVRNYRDKAIRMEIRHIITGDVDLEAKLATIFDYQTGEFTVDVKAHDKLPWTYKYTIHMGRNAKQNRIQLMDRIQ
jgi:hypothetical protein